MIAIAYKSDSIKELDALCDRLDKKVAKWLKLKYVGKDDSNVAMKSDAIRFFKELEQVGLKSIVYKKASELTQFIDDIENRYPDLKKDRKNKSKNSKAKVSNLYKCIERCFSNYGYDSSTFPNGMLQDDLGLTVCPYCNRNFVKHIEVKGKKCSVKGQLDHFYPRSLYPYLAITRENLVPSCPTCNGISGKHDDDTKEKGVVNPYTLQNSNGLKFSMSIKGKGFANLDTCAKAIKITVETPDNAMAANKEIFHLEDIYATHTDYAAEVYYKSILRMPQSYWQGIRQLSGRHKLGLTEADERRLALGVYANEKEYGKRPLSKFVSDLAKDESLI